MANGQSPFSSYDETGAPVYNGTATPAINNTSGYKSNDPYSNRDPRLAATVLYNGVNWGNGIILSLIHISWTWGDPDPGFMFDDIAIYNKALTIDEIQAIMKKKKN